MDLWKGLAALGTAVIVEVALQPEHDRHRALQVR